MFQFCLQGNPVLNNSTQPSVGHCDANVSVPGKAYPFGACYTYGFDTECGRQAWVKFIVDTVEQQNLDGIFIDGFQGCDPSVPNGSCRVLSKCTAQVATAWMQGLNSSLWALAQAFAGKNKTVICNDTGQTYACDSEIGCFCTASNDERFGGGISGAVSLMDYNKVRQSRNEPSHSTRFFLVIVSSHVHLLPQENPRGGVIVHVPHIAPYNAGIFNRSFAAFLLGAYDGYGFGIGFQYDCQLGGWLDVDKFPLAQKLGPPLGDAKIELASWPGANCTYTTAARPRQPQTLGCLMRRSFQSGVSVFLGQYLPPDNPTRPTNGGLCIWWSDGSVTSPDPSLCPPKPRSSLGDSTTS